MMLAACRNFKKVSRNAFPLISRAPVTIGTRFIHDAPGSEKLIYPEAPTKEHSDLATFLAYVERSRLNKKSTIYRGTHYEYTVAETLSQYGFFLKRVGGSSDRGMDLLGTWTLPSTSQTMNVIIQCKAGSRSPGPMYVRELKGAVKEAPPGWRGPNVLGLLVGEKPATKGVQEELNSATPLGYVCCSKEGEVIQLLWNHKAQEMGLEGISVGVRHTEGTNEKQLVLMKGDKVLPLLEKAKRPAEEVATIQGSED
ncbi:Fc.00g090960.m01.CDS01 [Cosmosporella sp. VM-42]